MTGNEGDGREGGREGEEGSEVKNEKRGGQAEMDVVREAEAKAETEAEADPNSSSVRVDQVNLETH